jgi:hypothetical protein
MTDKKLRYTFVFIALLCLAAVGNTTEAENQQGKTHTARLELTPESTPVIYPMRQEFVDSFERTTVAPWTTGPTFLWGIRDTANTYGPDTCAVSGYRYAGYPNTDIAVYPGDADALLTSPTIDITGWDSLYISFSQWGDFEGPATNFDGGIIEISNDNGVTWLQIDSLAQGHLNPTYDTTLAGGSTLLYDWAYCYDTPGWVNVSSMDLIDLGYAATGDQIRIRFWFCSDQLAGGQGWFIDDVRIADTSPPDLQPPVIVHTPLTDTTDTLTPYTVMAIVTDDGIGVDPDSVLLHYEIENGPILDVSMIQVAPDTFQGDIPAQSYHTDIWYQIVAADNAGNIGSTPTYTFEVTNARTIMYDDGQPYWTTSLTTGQGMFTQFAFSDVGIDSGHLHQVKFFFDAAGEFDLRVYRGTAGNPGPLLDSLAGLLSPGYQWHTVDITDLDIQLSGSAVAGIILGPVTGSDTLAVLQDPTLNYANNRWQYSAGVWSHPGGGGDNMIRLKVIPLEAPGIDENTNKPLSVFTLAQIAPNPVKKTGVIEYNLPTTQRVSLDIYDVAGQLIRTLVNEVAEAGTHQVVWDGRDARGNQVASGVYLYRLKGESESATEKLIFVR